MTALIQWPWGAILREARSLGAIAAGWSPATAVEDAVRAAYERWISEGANGTMDYLSRYGDVRFDPRLLLPGAKTVISLAFPYRPAGGYHHPCIADYALGEDYHVVLKKRLGRLSEFIFSNFGAQSRICVDTAPILERYWAARSGLGFIGLNRQLIVPGAGSGVFLAELVTTLRCPAEPTPGKATSVCSQCRRCIDACPGGALSAAPSERPYSRFDARLCRSYLSIEHRGELPPSPALGPCVYGCDICQRVCPYNSMEPPEPLAEFIPDPRLISLDRKALSNLSTGDWRRLTKKSAMRRVTVAKIKKNIEN